MCLQQKSMCSCIWLYFPGVWSLCVCTLSLGTWSLYKYHWREDFPSPGQTSTNVLWCRSNTCIFLYMYFLVFLAYEYAWGFFLLYLCFCACIWIIKFLLVHLCCHACLCVRPLNSLNVNQRSFPLWWSWYVTNGHPSKLETFGLSASEERVVFVYFSFPCVIVACNMLLYLSMFDFSSDCVRADFSGSGNISQGFCLMLCTTALWGWCFAQADRHSSCFGLVFGPFYALLLPIAVYCVCVCLCLSFGFVWCLQ